MTTIMNELTNTISDLAVLRKKQSYAYTMNNDIEELLSQSNDIDDIEKTAQKLISDINEANTENNAALEIWEENAIFFLNNVISNISKNLINKDNLENLSFYILYVIQEMYNLTRAALKIKEIKEMESKGAGVETSETKTMELMTNDAETIRNKRRQRGLTLSLPDKRAHNTRASNIARQRLFRSTERMPIVTIGNNGGMATRKKRKKKYRRRNKTKPKRYKKQIKGRTKKYRMRY